MKILKIIHGYPPEYNAGSEVYSQSICNELIKHHEVVLFSREENEYLPDFKIRETFTEHGIKHFRVNMARAKDGYNHPLLNERFAALLCEIRPDIAHIGHLNHLSTGVVDELHKLKIPILFTLHDFWLMCPRGQFLQRNFDGASLFHLCDKQEDAKCAEACYSMYYSGINSESDRLYWSDWINTRMKITSSLINKINLFHAPSSYIKQRFIDEFNIPEKKIFYLDYGFPTAYLQPVQPDKHRIFTFGYIGTHIPAKGVNLLINAFSKLDGKVKLKIFGRTNGQNTSALLSLASKSKNPIEFCGEYINHNLATTVFNHVDCIVVPSIWAENSPLVIHEAQACKIPIITADFGGMKEFVEHKKNGLLFKHRDVQSLVEQMEYASKHPDLMREFGNHGYLYSKDGQVLTIEKHCEILSNYYNKLVNYEK